MFDVFYTNQKPYLFPFEKPAKDLADAKAQCRTGSFWLLDGCCDYTDFDFEWRPDPGPAYIHAWGNQWVPAEYRPCVTFVAEGAKEYKFMQQVLRRLPNYGNQWYVNFSIEEFDYSWEPNPFDPPMNYVFGNQWHPGVIQPTIAYKVTGATETKYVDDIVAKLAQNNANWVVLKDEIDWEIDKSWVPNPHDPLYIYVFGNAWYSSVAMPTVEYRVPGAVDYKYCEEVIVTKRAINEYWNYNYAELDTSELDSWAPNPYDPPYIYVFGNQHYASQVMPTAEYRMPGATELKYVDEVVAKLLPNKERWSIPEEVDQTAIDFSWVPHPKDEPYVHHFGSEFQMSMGLTYTVPGATEPKFEGEPPLLAKERKAVQVLDIFFMDKSNFSSAERYRKLLEKYPNAQKIRYVNSNLETIQRCIAKAKTSKFWVISSENVYDDFNFEWHAQPWQSYMTHVFGSQWEKWSDTFLINKWEFERHTKWAKTLAEFPNLNFVKDQYVKTGNDNFDMYYVDHGNPDESLMSLKSRYPRIKVTRFVDNQLDALRRIMNVTTSEYVWVTSSLCEYTAFDFTWTPEPWQAEMIHCFGSEFQKRGDTFYIHVESFKTQMAELELLDWFNVICYHQDNLLLRYDPEHVHYNSDNLVAEIMKHEFKGPYAMFMNRAGGLGFEPCMWTQKDRTATSATADNGCVAIPRDIKQYLKTQVYDYPFIDKSHNKSVECIPMDVIFISYDETDADENWEILKAQYPSAQRLHGVEGMDNALKKAAEMSKTHWYYAVFAKTIVEPLFDFTFQPDLFQQPKHYIFHAHNPMNGLEYGHMGIVMYNCNIVKNMTNFGIDYTMSAAHEVVPIVSAIAAFNTTPYQTWRTAFREVAKLSQFNDETPTIENSYRLKTWTTKAEGEYAEWCLQGAKDAVAFYAANSHDKTQLKQAFDWVWLKQYFVSLHSEQ